jgi:hypothetical protein
VAEPEQGAAGIRDEHALTRALEVPRAGGHEEAAPEAVAQRTPAGEAAGRIAKDRTCGTARVGEVEIAAVERYA